MERFSVRRELFAGSSPCLARAGWVFSFVHVLKISVLYLEKGVEERDLTLYKFEARALGCHDSFFVHTCCTQRFRLFFVFGNWSLLFWPKALGEGI